MVETAFGQAKIVTKVWDQWSPRDWDQWVAARRDGHVLQLSGWGALKAEFGWRWRRLAVGTEEHPLAGAQLLLRQSMGLQVAYIPRGPLTDWSDVTLTTGLLDALSAAARKAGASVLKIEPDLPDTPLNRAWLAAYGFRPSQQTIQPPSTIVLDLQGDEESVLQRMKSKWRYNVRLAERKGVTVRALGLEDLATFHALMHTTGQRDGFAVHSDDYFTAAYRLLAPDHAVFLLAEYEGAPLGAIVVAQAGEGAWYLWGASSDRERNRMPNHALQWAGIRWARARGAAVRLLGHPGRAWTVGGSAITDQCQCAGGADPDRH
ncbi:MAG: peptidoglycan bridge formation glycyltransferase FemA/FemB family protein [Anaerolineales bacterium]|nr:peptidoglycan bridge formation glycyltransferase FemA/FemB family protein [Anaerolineales bacterium]